MLNNPINQDILNSNTPSQILQQRRCLEYLSAALRIDKLLRRLSDFLRTSTSSLTLRVEAIQGSVASKKKNSNSCKIDLQTHRVSQKLNGKISGHVFPITSSYHMSVKYLLVCASINLVPNRPVLSKRG